MSLPSLYRRKAVGRSLLGAFGLQSCLHSERTQVVIPTEFDFNHSMTQWKHVSCRLRSSAIHNVDLVRFIYKVLHDELKARLEG